MKKIYINDTSHKAGEYIQCHYVPLLFPSPSLYPDYMNRKTNNNSNYRTTDNKQV